MEGGEGRRVHVSQSSTYLGLVAVALVAAGRKARMQTRSSPPLLIWVLAVVLVVAPCVVVCVGSRGWLRKASKQEAITNDVNDDEQQREARRGVFAFLGHPGQFI